MTNGFVLEIGDLARKDEGVEVHHELDVNNTLDFSEVKPVSNITAKLTLMRTRDGIQVYIEDLKCVIEFKCNKCMDKFKQDLSIGEAQRVFYFEKQETNEDEMDQYYVDIETMTVDISDFVRQEIILQFPMIPVCSRSCKGLCPTCGQNLNNGKCKCSIKSKDNKPLSILKDLTKE